MTPRFFLKLSEETEEKAQKTKIGKKEILKTNKRAEHSVRISLQLAENCFKKNTARQ